MTVWYRNRRSRLRFGRVTVSRGMTLIEALVALLLLSLLSVGVVASFRLAHHSYQQQIRLDGADWDVVIAQRFLRGVLESAYPFEARSRSVSAHYGLEGTRERLLLTAPMPLASGSQGHYRYELTLTPRADGLNDWVIRSRIDRDGNNDTEIRSGVGRHSAREEALLQRVASVRWAYLEPQASSPGLPEPPPLWRDEWVGKTRLPTLVRVRIQFPAGDRRIWPDLVAAPRITDSATCDFDVVSQTCREVPQ